MLNISKKIYVGWDAKTVYSDVPEAEIIPIGTSPGEKRKMLGLESRHTALFEYDNNPLPGFTLIDVNKKTYTSPDSTWLIVDPRGFKTRISTKNLFEILKVTGITEGLVQQKCVWAREDSHTSMTLIPVSSDTFTEAIDNTSLIDSKINIRDVNIGDTVLLQNKKQGVYKGTLSLYCSLQENRECVSKPQTMLRRQIIEISPNNYYFHNDAKILKVVKKSATVITPEESAAELNANINLSYFSSYERMGSAYYSSSGRVRYVSASAVAKVKIKLEEIDVVEAEKLLLECVPFTDDGCLVVESDKGVQNIISFPYSARSNRNIMNSFEVRKILKTDDYGHTLEESPRINFYSNYNVTKPTFKLDNFTKFYKIVKCVKNDTYI